MVNQAMVKERIDKNRTANRVYTIFLLAVIFIGVWGCTGVVEKPDIVEYEISPEQAEQRNQELLDELSFTLADGLTAHLWASEELLSDPVALYMDDQGRAWVTSTERRRSVDLDIRRHRDWMVESITFETLEDRRNCLYRQMYAERSEETGGGPDEFN